MVVSVGLNIVEEQVFVRVLVEHEKSMMTDISESLLLRCWKNSFDAVARVGAMAVKPCSRQSAVDYSCLLYTSPSPRD